MKKITLLLTVVASLAFLSSCKKDDASTPTAPAFENSPTSAYYSYEPVAGGGWASFISFFDLRSNDVSKKKYFKIQLKFQGVTDSFEIATLPQSINNLAPGFPAEIVDYPGFGYVNQWTNPEYRLLSTGGSAYYKDTIVRNPASNIYYLYQHFLSGALQGERPQSNFDHYYEPIGTNGQVLHHSRTIFYFKKGLCIDHNSTQPGGVVKPISTLFAGAPTYDWQNINTAFQLTNSTSAQSSNLYFIDFKNWRFFRWKQYMNPIFSPAQLTTEFGDYQSLDQLFKWPEGWGRP